MSNAICSSTRRNRSDFFDIRVLFRGCQTLQISLQIHQIISKMSNKLKIVYGKFKNQTQRICFSLSKSQNIPKYLQNSKIAKNTPMGSPMGVSIFGHFCRVRLFSLAPGCRVRLFRHFLYIYTLYSCAIIEIKLSPP